jgi:hypothetical protein
LIRPLDTSLLDAVKKTLPSAPAQNAAAASGGESFATRLKREAVKTDTVAPAKTDAKDKTAARATPPEGEKWRPVKGHDDYAEIIEGDRKGQFVNLNRGARRGEAFDIEQRDGKTVHVYKKDDGAELVIPINEEKAARAAGSRHSDREPPKGETWAPVKGHQSYADILSGSRNGYYVNIQQGSAREGDVFHIVKRGGKEFHVYGTGKDKTWVEVGETKKKAEAVTGTDATQTTSPLPDERDASTATGTTATSTGGAAAATEKR